MVFEFYVRAPVSKTRSSADTVLMGSKAVEAAALRGELESLLGKVAA